MSTTQKTIALVTGASSGLGALYVHELSARYTLDEIWIIARREDQLIEVSKKVKTPCKVLALDLTRTEDKEKLQQELKSQNPKIQWLINNAGFGLIGAFQKLSIEKQIEMIELNVVSLTAITHWCLPLMKSGGKIVQVASSAGYFPLPYFAVYAATKSYVIHFSQALAAELLDKNISVTAVCPGPIATEFFNIANQGKRSRTKLPFAEPLSVVNHSLDCADQNQLTAVYGWKVKIAVFIAKFIPRFILKTPLRKILAK